MKKIFLLAIFISLSIPALTFANYGVQIKTTGCTANQILPDSLLEAMDLKLPVVGTNIPGIFEAVGPENSEFLSPPKDADAMANIILRLAFDPELRKQIGTRNHQRIQEHFSLQNMCDKHWEIIQQHIS